MFCLIKDNDFFIRADEWSDKESFIWKCNKITTFGNNEYFNIYSCIFYSNLHPSAETQICDENLPFNLGNALRYSFVTLSVMLSSKAGSISAIQQPLKPAPEKRPP